MAINFDINELDFDNLGSWPLPIKVISCVLICVLIVASIYWFDTRNQWGELARAERQENQLRKQFEVKQHQAASLNKYREQLTQMRKSFGHMLHQLPSRTEVPALLEDISKAGRVSGLEFLLFDPLQPENHEFYTELPINMSITGNYHQFGDFISRLAAINRIVTLHDFDISHLPNKKKKSAEKDKKTRNPERQLLKLDITAKTYNYWDDEEK